MIYEIFLWQFVIVDLRKYFESFLNIEIIKVYKFGYFSINTFIKFHQLILKCKYFCYYISYITLLGCF